MSLFGAKRRGDSRATLRLDYNKDTPECQIKFFSHFYLQVFVENILNLCYNTIKEKENANRKTKYEREDLSSIGTL